MREGNESHERESRTDQAPRLSDVHVALIRLCVASDGEFPEAFSAFFSDRSPHDLDHAATQLLGLVYRRAAALDLDHPVRGELAGHYRQTWHRNQMLLFRARPLLEQIEAACGRAVVLKGGAMVSSAYFDDLGVRPLADLDLLMEQRWIEPIVDWALTNGWRATDDLDPRDTYIVHHAIALEHGEEGSVDLHWALLVQGRRPTRDRELIAEARPVTLGGIAIHVLDPTHQLFHTAAHVQPGGVRHVVDALTIIERHREELDWDAFVEETIERRTIAYVLETLAVLDQVQADAVPRRVRVALEGAPRHWTDYTFHGKPVESRRELVKRFAADVVGRSRDAGLVERMRVARAMVRRFSSSSGRGVGELTKGFVTRGGEILDRDGPRQ